MKRSIMADSVRGESSSCHQKGKKESSSGSDTFNSTSKWEYDVFLSFAGKDTRLNFTGHLYDAFIRSGIRCFKDDVDLPRGKDINHLFQAIQDSLCAVLVISKNYANSKWCLDELQKILESRNTLNRWIFPIFYDVEPADVRNQRESFREAMAKHEENFKENTKKVQNWRAALSEIGNLSGWVTKREDEADLIQNIVGAVWTYVSSKLPSYYDNLIGIDSRVADMMSVLEIGLDDKRFVGIWGMGGVGKTTLARVVFDELSHKFEVCCFLANIRGTLLQREGLVSLQKRLLSHLKIKDMEISDDHEGMKKIRKLLCNKKVLLVLDDLDDASQLKNLAESPDWFGKGSKIIITTRDSQLLTSSGVDKKRIYEMKTMKEDESLQLFLKKAFKKEDHPLEWDYLENSKYVVEYAGGLPLALEVLGRFFCGRSKAEWENALDRLKQIPSDDRILEVLKISYDGLKNEEEKTIFLDIACFFKGWKKKAVTRILESCDLHATIGIKVLIQKTLLVETKDCTLDMHDLLEDLGRYIVRQESPNNVGKRSRLWEFGDIKEVLENNKGSENIQAIVMQGYYQCQDKIKVHPESFSKMSNISLLILGSRTDIIFKDHYYPLVLPRELKLSRQLKFVEWKSSPLEALPVETPLDQLVHIKMLGSKIKQLWSGTQFMRRLKFIDLSSSEDFIETPDFSGVPYLEHLCLKYCKSLVTVHDSLGELKELVVVDLFYCENLENLPRKLETDSLTKLDLRCCIKLKVIPEFGEGMKKLQLLDVTNTSVTKLPESLGSLTGLIYLNLSGRKILGVDIFLKTQITRQISGRNVKDLTELYLSDCGLNDGSIPDDFGSLSSLIVLDLSFNNFVNLATGCFSSLFGLVFLSLVYCQRLKSLPRLPPQLTRLDATGCDSLEPLSERQLWNWVASLDDEYRARTKYVISDDEDACDGDHFDYLIRWKIKNVDVVECVAPLRDFCAIISGREIPSWFPNKEYFPLDDKIIKEGDERREYEIKVDIPPRFHHSEWLGIVVCIPALADWAPACIVWRSKAVKDDYYTQKAWGHWNANYGYQLWIMVLELNEETCWQHLRGDNNSLHIKFDGDYSLHIMGCGWRVICKEEIKEWCLLNGFNQLTQPQLASPHDVNLPSRLLRKFIRKLEEIACLIQDTQEGGEVGRNDSSSSSTPSF